MQEIIDLTKELIRFKTTHDNPGEIKRCVEFVQSYCHREGLQAQRFDYDGIPSLAVLPQNDFAPVLLMSHLDVVAAADELFEPRIERGRLYGRGSYDDKYAVALSLVLLKHYLKGLQQQQKGQSQLPFGALFTCDEEMGGHNGAGKIFNRIKTDFGIALDGGDLDRVVVKAKGILRLKLVARGRSAHGSRPWLGDNAVDRLIDDYQRLKLFFNGTDPEHWHATLNLGRIRAGQSINQVPDLAEAHFDIRYTEAEDVKSLVAEMSAAVNGELQVEAMEPLFSGGTSTVLNRILKLDPAITTGAEHGATDARFLSRFGMDGVVWGASGNLSQHSQEEHVVIDSVYRLYERLDSFFRNAPSSS